MERPFCAVTLLTSPLLFVLIHVGSSAIQSNYDVFDVGETPAKAPIGMRDSLASCLVDCKSLRQNCFEEAVVYHKALKLCYCLLSNETVGVKSSSRKNMVRMMRF